MKTTARILAGLGTGVLVIGLAAFRDPGTLRQAQADGISWSQARMTPTSMIPSSTQPSSYRMPQQYDRSTPLRSAWTPWNGTSGVTRYAGDDDDRGWWSRDRDRDRDRDRRKDRDDRNNWKNRKDNGNHRGQWKKDRDDDHGKWNRRDRDDRGHDRRHHDRDDD